MEKEKTKNVLSLRHWIEQVKETGILREVRGANWDLEIGVITEINAKKRKYTLLFDEITGYPKGFRMLTGALLDSRRLAVTLGLSAELSDLQLVQALMEKLTRTRGKIDDYPPEYVSGAHFQENVKKEHEVDLLAFPAAKWHEHDGGRYIGTADCVITRDPDSGWINVGTYRLMVHSKTELGILIDTNHHARIHMNKYFQRGEPCPVAISLGHHPLLWAASAMEVPFGVSEFNYAGALIGEGWKVVKGPVTGLPIPADSEVVVEGHIVNELREEGPFGEFMGYYAGGVMKNPVIKVKALYYRNDPIIMGTAPGRPPYDYTYFRCPARAALIWDILEKAGITNIKGVWCHEAGYANGFVVISLKQAYAGHARQAGYIASQCYAGINGGRYVVVVDEDIDPTNLDDVIWAMSSRSDPVSSIEILRDVRSIALDPMVEQKPDTRPEELTSSRALIFACRPFSRLIRNTFPRVVESSQEVRDRFAEKWRTLLS